MARLGLRTTGPGDDITDPANGDVYRIIDRVGGGTFSVVDKAWVLSAAAVTGDGGTVCIFAKMSTIDPSWLCSSSAGVLASALAALELAPGVSKCLSARGHEVSAVSSSAAKEFCVAVGVKTSAPRVGERMISSSPCSSSRLNMFSGSSVASWDIFSSILACVRRMSRC